MAPRLFDGVPNARDAEYFSWMAINPNGLVGNFARGEATVYFLLHRAGCHHISTYTRSSRKDSFTTGPYIKVCSNDINDLISWAKRHRKACHVPTRCKTCNPILPVPDEIASEQGDQQREQEQLALDSGSITFDHIYKTLKEERTEGWTSGRTVNRSCFDLKNQAISDAIQKRIGVYVEAQFWMSKKRKNLNFEFATKNKDHALLREHLAASLRTFIFTKDSPTWLEGSTGSTVCKVPILDRAYEEADSIIKEYFRFIDDAIRTWSEADLIELLANVNAAPEVVTKYKGEKWAKDVSVSRMAQTALATVNASNGQQVLRTLKNKELRIKEQEFKNHIAALVEAQNGCCAISGLHLLFDGQEGDSELLCSLDRIDSNGHYEAGNLQVVCRFVNRWKSDGDDTEFRRLLGLVRGVGKA